MSIHVAVWAIVDAGGEVVDSKTTRVAAYKRVEFLDSWARHNDAQGKGPNATAHGRACTAPFSVVRCEGVVGA